MNKINIILLCTLFIGCIVYSQKQRRYNYLIISQSQTVSSHDDLTIQGQFYPHTNNDNIVTELYTKDGQRILASHRCVLGCTMSHLAIHTPGKGWNTLHGGSDNHDWIAPFH